MARRDRRAWRTRRPADRSPPAAACDSRPNPSSVSAGASTVAVGAVATPADSATSRRSMSTNRPDSGRFDQSALAVTWNSTIRPAPARRLRHQRRAVGQRGPGMGGEVGALARPAPGGSPAPPPARPGRRTASDGERREPGRLGSRTSRRQAGGRRPAGGPAAAVSVSSIGCLGGARAGEADQQPALAPPSSVSASAPRPAGSGRSARISTEISRLQQRREIAVAQLGERRQRAAQIVQRAGERRVGGGEVAGQQADRPPPPALVQQHDRCRRWADLPAPAGSAGCATPAAARSAPDAVAGSGRAGQDVGARQGAAVAALRQHHGLRRAAGCGTCATRTTRRSASLRGGSSSAGGGGCRSRSRSPRRRRAAPRRRRRNRRRRSARRR